jgi:cbb3-type cytochrome oxidase cytochrome c subunit
MYRAGALGILVTFFLIIWATVLMPMVLFNPKPSGHGNTYNVDNAAGADPARGRRIYVREGCFYCHTQFTRLQDRGYGPLVKAGDYVFETPHQLGTARTGPDLTNEGGRFPSEWQKAHLINPRAVKPGSIMPSFSYLSDRDMNDLVSYIQSLGNERKVKAYVEAPAEYYQGTIPKTVDTNGDAAANAGRGLYIQNCAACHGMDGRGDGPNSISIEKKPANFTRPFYKQYDDEFWYYRITEGVPGTRMPKWGDGGNLNDPRGGILTPEQRWYLVAYLKTLSKDRTTEDTVDKLDQVEKVKIEHLPVLTKEQWEPHSGEE